MMQGITAITTCSQSGFNAYGRRMVQSWQKTWPVELTVYTEGFRVPPGIRSRKIESIGWLGRFLAEPTRKGATDTYRHDAKRFAFKTAAVIEAATQLALNPANRFLIWADADIVCHAPVPPSFVESLLPESSDQVLSWLDRDKNYPETGFVVYDLQNPLLRDLLECWYRLYSTGTLYTLPEWHDAWVLQWVVSQFSQIRPKSISGDGSKTGHPAINGPLGAYIDHCKGARKNAGRSGRSERIVKDNNPYWTR